MLSWFVIFRFMLLVCFCHVLVAAVLKLAQMPVNGSFALIPKSLPAISRLVKAFARPELAISQDKWVIS